MTDKMTAAADLDRQARDDIAVLETRLRNIRQIMSFPELRSWFLEIFEDLPEEKKKTVRQEYAMVFLPDRADVCTKKRSTKRT